MKIDFHEPSTVTPLYVGGDRPRVATMSGVALIDAHRLVATHLAGMRMYLVRFDLESGTHEIVDTLPTTWHGKKQYTDLVSFDGRDRFATSNCEANGFSTYRLDGDHLRHERDYPILGAGFCHGATFVPGTNLLAASCTSNGRNVYFVDLESGKTIYQFSGGAWQPKDACFIDERRMAVIYQNGRATPGRGRAYDSKIELIEFDCAWRWHALLHALPSLASCNADQVVYSDGKLYVSNQTQHKIAVLSMTDGRLALDSEIEIYGFDFPHGVSVRDGLLAVSCYGDSTVRVARL